MLGADPLLERFDRMVDDATAAFLETLDDNEGATAKLYLQNAARVADEAWDHTEQGHHGPAAVGPLITDVERADPSPADDDSNEEIVYVPPSRRTPKRTSTANGTALVHRQDQLAASEGKLARRRCTATGAEE